MKELKPGDRVRVYDGANPKSGTVAEMGEGPSFPGAVKVVVRDGDNYRKGLFHEKQCRRLKPKKKAPERERAELRLLVDDLGTSVRFDDNGMEALPHGSFRMVELRPGEVVASDEAILKAVIGLANELPDLRYQPAELSRRICKALGLKKREG